MFKNRKAAGIGYQTAYQNLTCANYTEKQGKFTQFFFDRGLLPPPVAYYKKQFPSLRINTAHEWITVLCPFHNDRAPSLSINLVSGGFVCHACGAKGRDVLDFQMQRYKQSFKQAATMLGSWSGIK